jgi:toxin ParE1/3/4
MNRCSFTALAKQDLQEIADYIARDIPVAAVRLVERIRQVCKTTIARSGGAGTIREDLAPGLRCYSVDSYVVYFPGRNPVQIVRVVHGARDVNRLSFGE